MYQRIFVAVDGSDTSNLALEQALQLAKDQRARVRIVHALDPAPYTSVAGMRPFDAGELIESMRQDSKRLLATALDAAKAAGVNAETALIDGEWTSERAAQRLARAAKSWEADLIVVGTHGRRGFDRLMMGSVAEAIMRIADVPVLLVRGK
jgi:nucleotide-binding universal stress UspA family protein